eukprot:scaffold825_cov196-Alexandrium_tamarense.AAC.59
MKKLPAVVTIVLLCLEAKATAQSHARRLELDCPVDESADENNDQSYQGRFQSYSRGSLGRKLVESIRKKPESYYQDIVDNVVMLLCDVDNAGERCVDEGSSLAAKDAEQNCIIASDSQCPVGLCERQSNCYWNSVHEGQNRTTRFPPERYNAAETELYGTNNNSYARQIALFGIIGAVVAIVAFLIWIIFFVVRYLRFLCSTIQRKDSYRLYDIILPVVLYIIALVSIVIAASMAFVGNEDVSVGATNTFLHANGLIEDLLLFLGRSRLPLENIQSIVKRAALDAKGIFDGTDYVKRDAMQIVNSFVGFYELHSDGLVSSNSLVGFNQATAEFDEKVTPITDNVQEMLDTLELDLYDQADSIEASIFTAMQQLDSFYEQSLEWQNEVYYYEGQELGTRNVRRSAVMILFLVSLGIVLLGFLGLTLSRSRICSKVYHTIKLTGFVSSLLGTVALLSASATLCLTFVFHDACEVSGIVTRDFEPFVGDRISPAVNAAFNDTNLAVALNLTEKVDFEQKLEDGLIQIEMVNVSQAFQLVLEPLSQIQSALGSISGTALSVLNQATASNEFPCAFNDTYTKDTITHPWDLDRSTDDTPYTIRDNMGNPTSYDRIGLESSDDYMHRIYNKAGVCSEPSDCCIYEGPSSEFDCSSSVYADCDYGNNCAFPCENVQLGITEGYDALLMLYDKEQRMTADLGVVCPAELECPSSEFSSDYSSSTLVGSVEDYKVKITDTKESLVNLASTSVGGTMIEVEDFLCNMNVSFIERRYAFIKTDICGILFGGIAQINWALWLLGISLEVVAIVSHILAVRMKGLSQKGEESFDMLDLHLNRANVYA